MRRKLHNFLFLCFLCTLSGCGFGKFKRFDEGSVRKSESLMYASAVSAFEKKDYKTAKELFEKVADIGVFSATGEKAKAFFTDILYNERKFAAAAGSAEGYILSYPAGEKLDQMLSIKGNAYFQMLKGRTHVLEFADKAKDAFKVLINDFPASRYVPEARQNLQEIDEIMAEKVFSIGSFYFKEMNYHAAISRFDEIIRDYPGTKYRNDAISKRVEAYKALGIEVLPS